MGEIINFEVSHPEIMFVPFTSFVAQLALATSIFVTRP